MAILGMNGKLYRNTGTWASPTFAEIEDAKEVTVTLTKGEADVSSRATGGWRAMKGTLKDLSFEFSLVLDETDTADVDAIRNAFINGTSIELMALTGSSAVSGSEGPRADCEIVSFTRSEPLEDAITYSVTAKPTASANTPVWYEVA